MAHSSPQARRSGLSATCEIARRNRAATARPLNPVMKTAVTARVLAGDDRKVARASGAALEPEPSD
jgi:hypothetical protein